MEKRDRTVHKINLKITDDAPEVPWLHGKEIRPGDVLRSVNHKYKLIVLETKHCTMSSARKQKCTECDKVTFKGLAVTPNTHDNYKVNIFEESWYCPTRFRRFKVDNENPKKSKVQS